MARKPAADLHAAAQALAPVIVRKPDEYETPTPAQRAQIAKLVSETREKMLAHPRPKPLEHWKRVLENPLSCSIAKKMAEEAIGDIQRRGTTEDRIRIEAELQEVGRRIAKQMESGQS